MFTSPATRKMQADRARNYALLDSRTSAAPEAAGGLAPVDSQQFPLIAPGAPGYERQTAAQKQESLWRAVSATPYDALPPTTTEGAAKYFKLLRSLKPSVIRHAFDDVSDVRVPDEKALHPFGAVAKVAWEPAGPGAGKQTGLFASGGPGLARLSLGGDRSLSYVPGLALKMFVDGQPSKNLHAIHSIDGETDPRFFATSVSNVIPPATKGGTKLASFIFSFFANPTERPVSHFAEVTPGGKSVAYPSPVWRLQFVPATSIPADTEQDFRLGLAKLPVGTTLYDVYTESRAGKRELIGRLKTTSPFVASKYGDESLYFKHSDRTRRNGNV